MDETPKLTSPVTTDEASSGHLKAANWAGSKKFHRCPKNDETFTKFIKLASTVYS